MLSGNMDSPLGLSQKLLWRLVGGWVGGSLENMCVWGWDRGWRRISLAFFSPSFSSRAGSMGEGDPGSLEKDED